MTTSDLKKIIIIFAICMVAKIVVAAPLPEIGSPEERAILSIATNRNHISVAYRKAVIDQMLNEVNYFLIHLKLPVSYPLHVSDLKFVFVGSPWYSQIVSTDTNLSLLERIQAAKFAVSGSFQTTNYVFAFHGGKLWNLMTNGKYRENFDMYPTWAKTPSLVDTNGAYQLATQWLASVSVDVTRLNQEQQVQVDQWYYMKIADDPWSYPVPPTTTNRTLMPIYDVKWGEGDVPPVKVTVFGPTKELIELQLEDTSYSRRPPLIITNALELNRVPDPPIQQLNRMTPKAQTNSSDLKNSPNPPPFHREIKPKSF